jgi:dTDP-4-dehydrorhamnose reductase
MIGHQIYSKLSQEFSQVKVCIRKSASATLKLGVFNPNHIIDNIDLLHQKSLEMALKNVNPDIVINCSGSTLAKTKSLSPSDIIELNALFPQRLYEWCQSHSAYLIQFSNDEVFAGRSQPYDENTLPDSNTIYGKAKALGEISGPNCLTIRSSFLGPELENPTELFSNLALNPTQTLAVSRSDFYCGVTTNYLSTFVSDFLRKGLPFSGLYQIASHPISEFDLIHLLNRQFEWNLNVTEIPGGTHQSKILSNQKLLQTWHQPAPRWPEMANELFKSMNQQPSSPQASITSAA